MADGVTARRLPSWLLIGAPKCGTTAFASWLGQHPEAYLSTRKELYFFDDHWERGLDWYAGHFRSAPAGARCGEATPSYLYSDAALDRIAATVPDARLLILLRDPVPRAWSHYVFTRQLGVERRSFAKAVDDELADPTRLPWPGRVPGYVGGGRYAQRIRAVHDRLGRGGLLILFQEELIADPLATYATACTHLGLDPSFRPDQSRENSSYDVRSVRAQRALWALRQRGGKARGLSRRLWRFNQRSGAYQPPPPGLVERLHQIYADDTAQLVELIQRPLPAAWGVSGHASL